MGNAGGCCSDEQYTGKDTVETVLPATDEKSAQLSAAGKDVKSDVSMLQAETSSATNGSGKDKLQDAVTSFVRAAVRGRPVTLLRQVQGDPVVERLPAVFKISKDLTQISLVAPTSASCAELMLAVTDIRDVYTLEDDGEAVFPKPIVMCLTDGERSRLLRVYHIVTGGKAVSFCLLEATPTGRGQLLQTLRALYARAEKMYSSVELKPTASSLSAAPSPARTERSVRFEGTPKSSHMPVDALASVSTNGKLTSGGTTVSASPAKTADGSSPAPENKAEAPKIA